MKSNKCLTGLVGLLITFIQIGCKNKHDKQLSDPSHIYFDYQVIGREGDDKLTVLLKYRFKDEFGDALALPPPSHVKFDGELLHYDSTKMQGFYYEIYKPIDSFTGKHSIVFTDINQKEYRHEFDFQPLSLKTALPDSIGRDSLMVEVEGLAEDDMLQVILSDTAFANNDPVRMNRLGNTHILFTPAQLSAMATGPVLLGLTRETDLPVINATLAGGRFRMTYSLQREFVMKDSL